MAKYTYHTAMGDVEIKISKKWKKLLEQIDSDELTAERKHTRSDHKYAPGEPISLESLLYEGEPLASFNDYIAATELAVDIMRALRLLSETQRRYFIMRRIKGLKYKEIAALEGRQTSTIFRLVESATRKIQKKYR